MIGRRPIRTALTLAATGGLTLLATGLGSPASAGVNCAAGYHCVFYTDFSSSSHDYPAPDANFANDTFDHVRTGGGAGQIVNNNFESASNSSTSNYESHYWDSTGGTGPRLICLNPGSSVGPAEMAASGAANRGSSLTLIDVSSSIHCL